QGRALARQPFQEGARHAQRLIAYRVARGGACCPLPFARVRRFAMAAPQEGNLKAPYRHPLDWQNDEFWEEEALYREMERQFDICHTCRRCFSLCQSFSTLFQMI